MHLVLFIKLKICHNFIFSYFLSKNTKIFLINYCIVLEVNK